MGTGGVVAAAFGDPRIGEPVQQGIVSGKVRVNANIACHV
jgi:hypothetical protein